MIILDTHIWVWWNHNDLKLTSNHHEAINKERPLGLGISSISLIEITRLVTQNRLILPCTLQEWFNIALPKRG